jgi:hypothetical protein
MGSAPISPRVTANVPAAPGSSIVTYEHHYKPPPRKKPQTAKIEGPPSVARLLRVIVALVIAEVHHLRHYQDRPGN